jgi:hypothetical protein
VEATIEEDYNVSINERQSLVGACRLTLCCFLVGVLSTIARNRYDDNSWCTHDNGLGVWMIFLMVI